MRRRRDFLGAVIAGFEMEGSNVFTALYADTPQIGSNASSSMLKTLFSPVLAVLEAVDLVDRTDGEGEGAREEGRELERRRPIVGRGAGPGMRWILCLSIVMNSARAPD